MPVTKKAAAPKVTGIKKVTLTGHLFYPRLDPEYPDMGFEDAYAPDGAATAIIVMDEENTAKLKRAQPMKQLKFKTGEDLPEGADENGTAVKITRKVKAAYPQYGGPVKVVDADGDEWDFEENPIGNGTEATVKVTVYDTSKYGRPVRLEKVTITDYVRYERPEEDEEEEEDQEELEEEEEDEPTPPKKAKAAPKVTTKSAATKRKPVDDIEDETIPF